MSKHFVTLHVLLQQASVVVMNRICSTQPTHSLYIHRKGKVVCGAERRTTPCRYMGEWTGLKTYWLLEYILRDSRLSQPCVTQVHTQGKQNKHMG